MMKKWWICFVCITLVVTMVFAQTREEKLATWLKKFPEADTNKDGTLTEEEAKAFQNKQRREKRKKIELPPPTHSDVAYGPHSRNVLDLWLVPSDKPTPLLVNIHGGGFRSGDKRNFSSSLIKNMNEEGISVASINYRLTEEGLLKEGKNMYPAPMHDGARALQFLRYNASKYNLDKTKFAATGGSAGGCMLMWLGFHPDLAQPDHKDPVLRESSRLQVLAPRGGQTCVHGPTLLKWFGVNSLNLSKRKGIIQSSSEVKQYTAKQEALSLDASPITHLTPDDPPIYLYYSGPNEPVDEATPWGTWVHHPMLGIKLKEAMYYWGMECYLEYKDGPPVTEYESHYDFIIQKLKSLPKDAIKGNPQAGAGGDSVLTKDEAHAKKWNTAGLQQANSMGGGEAAISKSGKFRVFVLMGQSNMTGAARASKLKSPYNEKHDRIRIWANGRWEYFVPSHRFGPGVSMAHQLAELWPDDTIGIIKVASGGTGISGFEKNWSFERAELTWDGKKGPLYKDLMNVVDEAKRISEPEFCGFVWKQGAADGTRKNLATEYYERFKQLISDLRTDLGAPDLPVFVPSYMNDEELLKAVLSNMSDEDVLKAKKSASKPPENDEDLLKVLLSYIHDNDSFKAFGKRPYIGTVIMAQNRAGRDIPNVTTLYPGKLPRIGGDNNHINAEGQIKLGKIAASAVEEFYKAKE